MNRFENFQKNMQNKYNNIKQNVNEKIKKYVERFDVILKQLNKIKRRNSNDELQNFIWDFRSNHQFEFYKHFRHVNRQNLKTTIQRLENAKYYRNKHNKKNKNNGNNDLKKKNINDKKSQLYRWIKKKVYYSCEK